MQGFKALSFLPIIKRADSEPSLLSGNNSAGFQLIPMEVSNHLPDLPANRLPIPHHDRRPAIPGLPRPIRTYPGGSSCTRSHQKRFNPLMADHPAGINQTGLNIFHLQPGLSFQNHFGSVSGCKHTQNVLHSKTAPANDRFSPEDFWVDRNSFQQLVLIHKRLPGIRWIYFFPVPP